MEKLTPRQKQILDYITDFRAKNSYSPSVREIGEQFDISSPNGVVCHISALKRKGAIKAEPNLSRSIVPITQDGRCPHCNRRFRKEKP